MPSDGSDSENADIQMKSPLPKTTQKKLPKSPSDGLLKKKEDKKLTTKEMIYQALTDLKSRKGVSLYAIKKYVEVKYRVDTEKINYHIKNCLKTAVEQGTIIQTKGIGATGSFKLAPVKENKPKTKKPKKEKIEKTKDPVNTKNLKERSMKTEGKSLKSEVKSKKKESKEDKPLKPKKKVEEKKKPNEKKDGGEKIKKKLKIHKDAQTPSKKKAMLKRKSVGSIIKPPKMKPAAKT